MVCASCVSWCETNSMMVKFTLKLAVVITGTLAVAAYLSWTRDFVNPYANPQIPLRDSIEAGKRETQDGAAKVLEELKSEESKLHPKIALNVENKDQQHDNNLPQIEGSQENSNQRTDNKDNEAPQVLEKSDHVQENNEEGGAEEDLQGNNKSSQNKNAEPRGRIQTFFTALQSGFSGLRSEGNEILTKEFLEACTDLTPFLDKFNSVGMNLARKDLTGNARKINAVYEVDPEVSKTLQKMVLHELDNGDFKVDGKGTISLLWLKRGFEFVAEFLLQLAKGEDTSVAATSAYDQFLAPHHNFILRGTFKLAVTTLPYRNDFFKTLAENPEDASDPQFIEIVAEDMINYNKGLQQTLQDLRDFYNDHGLSQ